MKALYRRLSVCLLVIFALTAIPAKAQPDLQNLTPQQQKIFEEKLRQHGIAVDYNKLTPEEKDRYFRQLRQGDQRQTKQQRQPNQNINANNPYNNTLVPLTDFGTKTYQGLKAGLYPNGENLRPKAHNAAGLAIAKTIKPLNRSGNIDEKYGRIVWLSIGMSNTTQETARFLELMKEYPRKNPFLQLIDGAFGGQAINQINNPKAPYWDNIVKQRLEPNGISPEQVQVVWFKLAESAPKNTDFLTYTRDLKEKYLSAMHILKTQFPNLKIVYLSSRIYGGYAKTGLNPEPFAWYTGWANKLLIEDQINGDPRLAYEGQNAKAPWLSWGPYLWANGKNPNAQGISWLESDMRDDGTHPSPDGRQKVAESLIKFFSTDETATPWFLLSQEQLESTGLKNPNAKDAPLLSINELNFIQATTMKKGAFSRIKAMYEGQDKEWVRFTQKPDGEHLQIIYPISTSPLSLKMNTMVYVLLQYGDDGRLHIVETAPVE